MSPEPVAATFPSTEWFDALVAAAKASVDVERLGFAELRLAFEMRDPDAPARRFGVVFDGYEIDSAGELDDLAAFDPDVVVEGDLAVFEEMVENVVSHHGADGAHTLNALTIAGTPLELRSDDPVRRDRAYRYAESIQQLLDAAALVGVPARA